MNKVVVVCVCLIKMLSIHATTPIVAGYVANSTGNTLVEFNVPFNTVVSSIPTSISSTAGPSSIAISADGLKVYVANKSSNTIGVIDPSTYAVTTISHSSFDLPVSIFINPSGTQAYVVNNGSSTVSVLDLSSDTVIQTIAVGYDLKGGVFRPDGVYAYVTSAGDDFVYVIETSASPTASVFTTIAIGNGTSPNQIAMNNVASSGVYYAYVTCSGSNSIRIIDTSLNTVSSTVSVGGGFSLSRCYTGWNKPLYYAHNYSYKDEH